MMFSDVQSLMAVFSGQCIIMGGESPMRDMILVHKLNTLMKLSNTIDC